MVKNTLKDKIKELRQTFSHTLSNFYIYYNTSYLQSTKIHWTGNIHLGVFVQNLPTIKNENLQVYKFLVDNHKEVIKEIKELLVKLKLQGLPTPYISIRHSNYCGNQQKGVMNYDVCMNRCKTSKYFFDLYAKGKWGNHTENKLKAKEKEKQYLAMINPVIVNTCEVVALTICNHLGEVCKDVAT